MLGAGAVGRRALRRRAVEIPTEMPQTDAVFVLLRRMRRPLIGLIAIFTVGVIGLTLIPGVDSHGNPYHLSAFDAFYHMSITATTIGFSETPYTFTVAQRMWVVVCIFASVIGWAYAIAALLSILNDPGFRRALALQGFRRKVAHLREPFHLLVGYGEAGRALVLALDRLGRRVVILDEDPNRLEILISDSLVNEVPNFSGDPRNPSLLGVAGLSNPHCEGVLALTDKDEQNLAVVMATRLLRPTLPTIARCSEKRNMTWMEDFSPHAIINPFDRYGSYLVMALQRPATFRLASWLISTPGTELSEAHEGLGHGLWVVFGDNAFATEVAHDLEAAGMQVRVANPDAGDPDVTDAVGLVAGSESDTLNMSVAAHARLHNPDIHLTVRQKSATMGSLVRAFSPDSVFVATDLVASEALARLEAPLFWGFVEHVTEQDDEWSAAALAAVRERVGDRAPTPDRVVINRADAPAVVRWLDRGNRLTIGELLRHPDDRDEHLSVIATVLVRDDKPRYLPSEDEPLQPGDSLGILSRSVGRGLLQQNLHYDSVVQYLGTGELVPDTWFGRLLAHRGIRAIPDSPES